MADSFANIVNVKNEWLSNQVEVEFPTPESLRGRKVYQQLCEHNTVSILESTSDDTSINPDDIYLVDFHRLTVMFSLLQASRANSEQEQNDLLEFFTQIIFSEPCSLYVGFYQSEPVAAAIITQCGNELLVSDIVNKSSQAFGSQQQFASAVVNKWRESNSFDGVVYIEA